MSKIKVLIVEDDIIIASDIAATLTKEDYEPIDIIESGDEVINAVQQLEPDIVLMDIRLDGKMDGIEAARLIHKQLPRPVIFLTANTDEATFNRAKSAHPYAFLKKPFDRTDLKYAIELAMERFADTHTLVHQNSYSEKEEAKNFVLKDRIFIKIKEKFLKIHLEEILWIKAEGNYCEITCITKNYLVGINLKTFEERLSMNEFMRVHRSYIVNLSKVDEIGEIYLSINRKEIPYSKEYKEEILQHLKLI